MLIHRQLNIRIVRHSGGCRNPEHLKGYSDNCITSEAWCSAERKVTLRRLTSEKTLFFCSHSVPFTLHTIHLHSICELATGLKQRESARSRGLAAWRITIHRQDPKVSSMSAPRNSDPHSSNVIYYVKKHWMKDSGRIRNNNGSL
jgi:hypothetical protein